MKSFKRALYYLIIFSLIFFFVPSSQPQAGSLTTLSDVMTRLRISLDSNHTITFDQAGTTQFVAGETIALTFASGFDLTDLANTDPLDYDITVASTDESIVAATGCSTNDAIAITSIVGQVITFTACTNYTPEVAGSLIIVKIGTHTTVPSAGDSQIANPGTSGSKTISIGGTFGDTGALAVPIMDDDQVQVTASVDPTITAVLSSAYCLLGTLTPPPPGQVDTCNYTNTVYTNATSGYNAKIQEDGNLRSGANDINDAGVDNDIDAGSEEYGVGTSDDSETVTENDDCDDPGDDPEPAYSMDDAAGTQYQYASSTGPVGSGDPDNVITLCHAASIDAETPAGSYAHTVTHITTGNF